MKCEICGVKFNPPVRRGRNPQFCSPKCRTKHQKEWRKFYDARGYVKAAKSKREIAKYHRERLRQIEQDRP